MIPSIPNDAQHSLVRNALSALVDAHAAGTDGMRKTCTALAASDDNQGVER